MAADMSGKMLERNKETLQAIFTSIRNAVVYMDSNIAEILHWSGRTLDMIDAGAIRIQSIDSGLSAGKDERKAVFISSSLLPGRETGKLQKIIERSHFQSCTIFCTVTDADMLLAFKQAGNVENESFYEKLQETVAFWMNHKYATVEIRHIPYVFANVVPGLFFMPSFSTFFPILPSDLPSIQELLKTKGDQRKFGGLSEVDIKHTPKVFQVKLRLLASALSALFDELEITEDCYAVGHTSKLLAAELVNISSTKTKKNIGSRCAVIFVDRTLDMVEATSKSFSTFADKIFELLPRIPGHHLDVMVDMTDLVSSVETKSKNHVLVPGSLARNPKHKAAHSLLSSIVTENKQDCLSKIYNKLVKILQEESISIPEELAVGKATVDKLSSLMKYFRNNMTVFFKHSAVLQLAMAAVNTIEYEDGSNHKETQSTEKVLQLSLNEENSPSCLSHILMLLRNVKDGIRSYTFEDILLLLVYLYSLVGDESSHSLQEERQIQETIVQNILSGALKVKTKFIIDTSQYSEKVVRNKIAGCFQRLSGLKHLRDDLTSFRDIFTNKSSMHNLRSYQPLLKQIVEKVFDPKKAEISDIDFKSARLKDFIKSGFSLFMNVSKPHPSDHAVLFLFVVGGITCSEVRQIKEFVSSQKIKAQVILGSTSILNSQDILRHIFCQDLFMPYS